MVTSSYRWLEGYIPNPQLQSESQLNSQSIGFQVTYELGPHFSAILPISFKDKIS